MVNICKHSMNHSALDFVHLTLCRAIILRRFLWFASLSVQVKRCLACGMRPHCSHHISDGHSIATLFGGILNKARSNVQFEFHRFQVVLQSQGDQKKSPRMIVKICTSIKARRIPVHHIYIYIHNFIYTCTNTRRAQQYLQTVWM